METQNIANLLNDSNNQNSKLVTKKRYVIDNESKSNYGLLQIKRFSKKNTIR